MSLKVGGNAVTFWLRVKPRSSREGLELDSAGELRLQLHAAPTEGQANEACVRYLAGALRLPLASVVIVAGAKSRRKLIRIAAHDPQEIADRLSLLAGGPPMRLTQKWSFPTAPRVPSTGGGPRGGTPA
jgi:uncharacterized protein (TIGR00251 family)